MKMNPIARTVATRALPVLAFLVVGLAIPHFLSPANLLNVVRQSSIIAVSAVGMTLVIIIKGIDLSISGLLALCPMVAGLLMLAGAPVLLALGAGVLSGIAMGLFSGLMVARLAVPAFITTLVVGQVGQGLALVMNGGRSIGGFPASYVALGNGAFLGIPISDYVMVAFLLLGLVIMRALPIGTHILALGGNEQVLRQEGLSVARLQLFVFGFSGFCAAAAGLLLSAQLDTVHPIQGEAYQLDAIAACIIGGVDLAGGHGSVATAVVGALVIGCIRNALNLLGVHPFMQNIFVGVIIVAIVFASGQLRRRSALAVRGAL